MVICGGAEVDSTGKVAATDDHAPNRQTARPCGTAQGAMVISCSNDTEKNMKTYICVCVRVYTCNIINQLCCCLVTQLCLTLRPHGLQHARLPCPSPTPRLYQSLPKLMSIESVMPQNHLVFCHPLLLLPSVFPSIKAFSSESVLHIKWPKFWSFSFSISPSNEY